MKTKVLDRNDTLLANLEGARKLYKAVKVTMGPRSSNVIFKKKDKRVAVTHDGVTVAKAFAVDDETQAVGADLLREAAMKLDALTGDGTTTVTVVAFHILRAAISKIMEGANASILKRELEELQAQVVRDIEELADTEVTEELLIQVATTAAGDGEIGQEVGKLIFDAGEDTPILLDFSDDDKTTSEVIRGYKINSGAASPYLVNGLKAELGPSFVVCVDAKLREKEDIVPILQVIGAMEPQNRSVLLVVSDISGDALSIAVLNHLKQSMGIAIARVPAGIGSPSDYLEDVAISTGGKVLSKNTAYTIVEPQADNFGHADKIVVEPGATVIVGGKADPEVLATHFEGLSTLSKEGKTPVAKKFAKDRLAGLSQTLISIRVGAQSESEAEERHYRYEDAVGACRAALRNGVLPGGGTVLYSIGKRLENDILGEALKRPLKIILESVGIEFEEDSVLDHQIQVGFGFDVTRPEDGVINLMVRGIVDPAESEIEAVKTAISIAGLLMSAGAMIVDVEDEDESKVY